MAIDVQCPKCQTTLHVADVMAGQFVACTACHSAVLVNATAGALPQIDSSIMSAYQSPNAGQALEYRVGGQAHADSIKRWFRIWIGLYFGVVAVAVATVLLTSVFQQMEDDGELNGNVRLSELASVGGFGLCGIMLIVAVVTYCVTLYKMWQVIPSGEASTTPGKAVGFLFIPFFNLYWFSTCIGASSLLPRCLRT